MPHLRTKVISLHDLVVHYISDNIDDFWNSDWENDLEIVTSSYNDLLMPLPSVLRSAILRYAEETKCISKMHLVLFHDCQTMKEVIPMPWLYGYPEVKWEQTYFSDFLVARCLGIQELSLRSLKCSEDSTFITNLSQFTKLVSLTLDMYSGARHVISAVAKNLPQLEHLIFIQAYRPFKEDYNKCILQLIPSREHTGCPMLNTLKLADLPISNPTIQKLLIGLSHLIVLEHKNVIGALHEIDKKHLGKLSKLSNVHTQRRSDIIMKSLTSVMGNTTQATSVTIYLSRKDTDESFGTALKQLTHVSEIDIDEIQSFHNSILPAVCAYGYQLRILTLYEVYGELIMNSIVTECVNLEYLRLKVANAGWSAYRDIKQYKSYGLKPSIVKPVQNKLHTLILDSIIQSDCKSSLFKSLLASPNLKHLSLSRVSNFTGPILTAVQTYRDAAGTPRAFQHLKTLTLRSCNYIGENINELLMSTSNPISKVTIDYCKGLSRKMMPVIELSKFDFVLSGDVSKEHSSDSESSSSEEDSTGSLYDSDSLSDESEQS